MFICIQGRLSEWAPCAPAQKCYASMNYCSSSDMPPILPANTAAIFLGSLRILLPDHRSVRANSDALTPFSTIPVSEYWAAIVCLQIRQAVFYSSSQDAVVGAS